MDKTELGSKTARGGFSNEKAICRKFNSWRKDKESQEWLKIMGYNIRRIDSVKAIHVPTRIKKSEIEKFEINEEDFEDLMRFKKADAQIRIVITIGNILKIENLSLKKANSNADYNQVDKRSVDAYQEMWNFDDEIACWLKLFTGENNPKSFVKLTGNIRLRDRRRLFFDEMPEDIRNKTIEFFKDNKIIVVSDILKGRGGLSANWMLVTRYNKIEHTTTWALKDINTTMNFFGGGDVKISPRGSLYIGKITMQRKGGTPDPTKLQFKIKPCQLFKLGE
ncbi:MAG: R.HinP1I restriction endonuclease [Candidatus Argoarchaeum ethanivorans]|uniref:R.HinP1I restriction endonuclease n=1 Tax=Candidatus Argoarchaeum ethanivorans TaxID=2608793 RepID=A0A811ZZP4_9EURY|nr:MAG: R.HinP1I restriction endonuclease [Candidatus Argoarchaeum ethanivorans]